MLADHGGRPPLRSPESLSRIDQLRTKAQELALQSSAPRPLVLGRHLVALGRAPGPEFKAILDAAFEAQLDGAFTDETGGVLWLRNHLGQH
jgi:tRNA nucleotidyltransferase (CCA-adding enzyme)